MTEQRIIEILAEVCGTTPEYLMTKKIRENQYSITRSEALSAMQRYAQEQTDTLRAEAERLKGCEAIVRECGTADYYSLGEALGKARQWVKNNTTKN